MSVRITAGGVVLVVGLSLLAIPARACDDRQCNVVTPAVATKAPVAKPRRVSKRVRIVFVSRAARRSSARRHRRAHAFVVDRRAFVLASVENVPVQSAKPESVMSRRFRGFIDPQFMADNAFEDMRKPRPDPSHLSQETSPAATSIVPPTPVDARDVAPTVVAAVVPSPDTTETVQPIVYAEAAQRQSPADPPPGGFSIHQLLLALGGALTAASALRFIVGA